MSANGDRRELGNDEHRKRVEAALRSAQSTAEVAVALGDIATRISASSVDSTSTTGVLASKPCSWNRSI